MTNRIPPIILPFLTRRALKYSRAKIRSLIAGQTGNILIGLIVTIVIFASLGAAMLSLFTTSTFSQIGGNSSMRAYYLAESGYRYAAVEYRNSGSESAKDDKLESLHNRTFTLANDDGCFELKIYPYYYKTTTDHPVGCTMLNTEVKGDFPPELSLSSGYLKVEGKVYPYSSAARSDSNVTFMLTDGTLQPVTVGTTVYSVSHPDSLQTVTDSSNVVTLESSGSANAFPVLNGSFRIYESSTKWSCWSYKKRDGNRLEGIAPANDPDGAFSVTVDNTNDIMLDKFIKLKSTGIVNKDDPLETRREIVYHIPIPEKTPTEKVRFHEHFEGENLPESFAGGEGEIGGHKIEDESLRVTTENQGSSQGTWSRIFFNWENTTANLANIWAGAGHLLSYDLQVKVKVDAPYYIAGISFRESEDNNYGISYLKGLNSDDIPQGLKPPGFPFINPAIVLWQKTGDGYKWLAYKVLENSDYVVLKDWPNLQIRVIEAYPLDFTNGACIDGADSSPFLYGDIITGAESGATARVNGTPILTSGSWDSGNAVGILTLSNVNSAFQGNEDLLAYGNVRAKINGTPPEVETKTNFIRVYYCDVSEHPPFDADPLNNNRNKNPRVTESGQAVRWPVDNVSGWAAGNDYLTLVQWDSDVDSSVTRLGGSGTKEENAIIRTDILTSPDEGDGFDTDRPEIALHTFGDASKPIYFDDFAIQVEAISGSRTGFLPPIQQ